jgi:xanthine dehydrogenase YagR molybdenum-binding subunit
VADQGQPTPPPAVPAAPPRGQGPGPVGAPPEGQGRGGRGAPQPPADPKYHWPATRTVIGTPVKRVDGPDKVTGKAKYTFDINRPGMLYARILRSPHPHARVVSVDLTAARRAPGVKEAIVWKGPGSIAAAPQGPGGGAPPGEAMFQGDEVAAVVADTEERAIDAARLIVVQYEVLPHLTVVEQAMLPTAPAVFNGGNVRQGQTQQVGDLAAGLQAAAHTIDETYATHVITHACMESHGTVCEWAGEKLTVWISTQGINGARDNFATGLGIPRTDVRVICQYMGGGFGSKALTVGAEGLICARLAKLTGAPVKLMLDRKEEHLATGNRPSAAARVKAGVSADGMITAFDAESWGTGGAGAAAGFPLPYIYQMPNRRRTHKDVFINAGQQRPMRAPGHPQGSFITEIMMDELADKVNMDPVEFRIKNLPPQAPNAMWRAYLREGATEFGWDKRHPTGDKTAGPIKTGMGVAICTWGGGGSGPSQAHCEIASDGGVVMRLGSQDLGTGTRTFIAAITADTLGLQASQITAEIGDTNYGVSPMSGGSTTAAGIAPAQGESRARAWRRRRLARRRERPHSCPGQPVQGPFVDRRVQADRRAADRRGWQLAAWAVVGDHQRRAVCRGLGRHRNRHREADADSRDSGLRPGHQPPHGGKPGVRRRHRLAQLRDVRRSHPRSQHRADGQPEHGVVPAGRHVGHSEDRRAPERSAGARRDRHRRAAHGADRRGDCAGGAQRDRRHHPESAADAGEDSDGVGRHWCSSYVGRAFRPGDPGGPEGPPYERKMTR